MRQQARAEIYQEIYIRELQKMSRFNRFKNFLGDLININFGDSPMYDPNFASAFCGGMR